jgi:hypothetical protein
LKRFVLVLALLAAPVPALACSPAAGYRVPTNLELADRANLILLGEVTGAAPGLADDPFSAGIAVQPLTAVKGLMPSGELVLHGMVLAAPDRPAEAARSDPAELREAHPQSFTGACIRRVFPQGARVLFFLERRDGEWVPAGGPFSRWAEDVADRDAPWVQLATLYAHASLLTAEERVALLEDQVDALQARPDSAEALAMAGDIERQLAGPNEPLVPEALPAVADEPEMAPEIGEFREPDELSAVQRALDAMRAD